MDKTQVDVTHGNITAASAYWIPFLIFVVGWIFAYFFIEPVRTSSNIVFDLMKVDPNVLIAFIGLLALFIGWSFLEFLSIKAVHISRYHDDQMYMVKRGIRIITTLYPAILITCRYVTIWSFTEWPLYLFGLVLFVPFFILLVKTKWFVTQSAPDSRVDFDLKNKKIYIPIQIVLLIAFTAGPLFIIILSSFTENVPWIDDFVGNVLIQFIINPVFITMGLLLLFFTFFYPFTEYIAWKFAKLAKLIITKDTKKAMKKVRIYMCAFVLVLTISKLFPLTLPQLQLIDQGNLLYSAISGGLVGIGALLQAKIIMARSKIAQKKMTS
jgi:hypothetical protein